MNPLDVIRASADKMLAHYIGNARVFKAAAAGMLVSERLERSIDAA